MRTEKARATREKAVERAKEERDRLRAKVARYSAAAAAAKRKARPAGLDDNAIRRLEEAFVRAWRTIGGEVVAAAEEAGVEVGLNEAAEGVLDYVAPLGGLGADDLALLRRLPFGALVQLSKNAIRHYV